LDLDSDPKDSDLDSGFAHETKVKAIHELLVNTGKVCFSTPSVIRYLLTYCICDSPSFVTTVFTVDKFL